MSKIIPITGFCTVPDNITDEEFNDWLQFELGNNGDIPPNNPLLGINKADILNYIAIDD